MKVPTHWLLTTFQRSFLWATYTECLYVLVQICTQGVPSAGVTGTLDNPAGLSFNLCVALAVEIQWLKNKWEYKREKAYGWAYCIVMMTILFLTKSRTGLLCATFYGVAIGIRYLHAHHPAMHYRHILYTLAFFVTAGYCTILFLNKKDSTSGRAFILKRSIELAMEHPWKGHGHGGFEKEYMLRQADFFCKDPDSKYALLADEVHHPLNEFVYLWVNYGITSPLILLAVLVWPIWRCSHTKNRAAMTIFLVMLAIFVFSCFSYPFYYPIAWLAVGASLVYTFRKFLSRMFRNKIMLVLLMAMSISAMFLTLGDAMHEHLWYRAYRHSFRNDSALSEYEQLHGYFRRSRHFLYNYAMASFKRGDLKRAECLLEECGEFWNGYNRELLYGDVCFYQQKFPQAIFHYQKARNMCPVRFAPLEGLYKVYESAGDEAERKKMANIIAKQEVKIHSPVVDRIKKQCK